MKLGPLNSVRAFCLIAVAVPSILSAAEMQAPSPKSAGTHNGAALSSRVDLKLAMRSLWEEHIVYTRNYIISALAGLPDADAIAQRLLSNQDDIGSAVKPYYGETAGKKLSTLLRDHILIATEVVKAAKASDKLGLKAAQTKWSANGKDLASFLSGANPNWPQQSLEGMLQTHLDLTSAEVVGRLNKDWAADIKAYDAGHAHMLMFADTLSEGIAKQFPARFTP